MVLQEEEGPNNGSGGETPKKTKPFKIPQRGLGIAALEKLRREEHQKRIEAGDSISAGSGSSTSGVIFHSLQPQPNAASNFLPLLDPSSSLRPFYVGNYTMFRPPLDPRDNSTPLIYTPSNAARMPLVPRRMPPTPPDHPQHPRYLMNSLSPPSSSTAGVQMEPPSNQSYVSMNTSSRPEEQRLVGTKRPWPFHPVPSRLVTPLPPPNTALPEDNELKRTALSREEASSSSSPQTDAAPLDATFLSLAPPTLPLPSPSRAPPTQQHEPFQMQRMASNRASETAAAMGSSALHNFMGLPDDVMEEQRAAVEGGCAWRPPILLSFDSAVDIVRSKHGDGDAYPNDNID